MEIKAGGPPLYTLVTDEAELQRLCSFWLQCEVLAVDTEFVRTSTFYPNLGLIQINDGQAIYLIDCVAISDLSAFSSVLESDEVLKIFHAPSEDLEVLYHRVHAETRAIFDVQLAAAMVGLPASLSLQALLEDQLAVKLPKGLSRSDWMARPLPDDQLCYAADDVVYLLDLYHILTDKLHTLGRFEWVVSEGLRLQKQVSQNESAQHDYYKKVGAAALLNPYKLALFKDLCIWREALARELNVPRSRLISDKTLLDVAQKQPASIAQLSKMVDFHSQAIRKYGQTVLDFIERAKQRPADDYPPRLPKPLTPPLTKRLKRIKLIVSELAENIALAPSILLRKADYAAIMNSRDAKGFYCWPESIAPWRSELVKDAVLLQLNAEVSEDM
jgi:ribonuclease D